MAKMRHSINDGLNHVPSGNTKCSDSDSRPPSAHTPCPHGGAGGAQSSRPRSLVGNRAAVQPSASTHAPLPADGYDSTGSGARKRPRSCHPAAGTVAEPSPAEPEIEGAAEAPSPGHENLETPVRATTGVRQAGGNHRAAQDRKPRTPGFHPAPRGSEETPPRGRGRFRFRFLASAAGFPGGGGAGWAPRGPRPNPALPGVLRP